MSDKIAEIERLRAENERLRADNERLCAEMPVAEALRINAERLEMQRNDACGVIERQARKIVDLSASVERLRENVDRAGKEVERADRLRAEIARVKSDERENRAEIERLRVKNEWLRERLLQERDALVLDELGAALERERVLRAALTDMMSGWRYIRDTYGDLAGVGWDRVEQKAREALEGKS
jgi:predicted RNase H-like nuclease (RuvC/YqgF family)